MATPHRYVGYHQAPSADVVQPHPPRLQPPQHRPSNSNRGHRSQSGGHQSRQQGRSQQQQQQPRQHHVRTQESIAEFDRSGRLLTLGIVFMLFGLILYFGGGYLFVAAYNGVYPIVKIPVDENVHRYYWWVGPICFFIGLFMFIIAFATFCKGLKCHRRTEHPEGYF